jgi:hypothetical protein
MWKQNTRRITEAKNVEAARCAVPVLESAGIFNDASGPHYESEPMTTKECMRFLASLQ